MTIFNISRLNLDLQHVKEFGMRLEYTEEMKDKILEIINFYDFVSLNRFYNNNNFIDMLGDEEVAELAEILFKRDKMDLTCLYDNNDIHGLSQAAEELLKAFTTEMLLSAATKMRKILISHYLPEIKAIVDEVSGEYMISALRYYGYTKEIDDSNGYASYVKSGHEYQL